MNRAQRRRRVKNRDGTRKGMTKVIFMDGNSVPTARYVPAGGKIHKQAIKNSQKFRESRGRGSDGS